MIANTWPNITLNSLQIYLNEFIKTFKKPYKRDCNKKNKIPVLNIIKCENNFALLYSVIKIFKQCISKTKKYLKKKQVYIQMKKKL